MLVDSISACGQCPPDEEYSHEGYGEMLADWLDEPTAVAVAIACLKRLPASMAASVFDGLFARGVATGAAREILFSIADGDGVDSARTAIEVAKASGMSVRDIGLIVAQQLSCEQDEERQDRLAYGLYFLGVRRVESEVRAILSTSKLSRYARESLMKALQRCSPPTT